MAAIGRGPAAIGRGHSGPGVMHRLSSSPFSMRVGQVAIRTLLENELDDEDDHHVSLSLEQELDADLHWLLGSRYFNGVIVALIVANAAQIGLSIEFTGEGWDDLWDILEHFFTAVFALEMIAKVVVLRRLYFSDYWNLLDFTLVWCAIIDTWLITPFMSNNSDSGLSDLTAFRVVRLCRIVRMVRMFEVFSELYIIMEGMFHSLRAMAWVSLLLFLVLYVCAIFCVELVGNVESYPGRVVDNETVRSETLAYFNNYMYFGSIPRSMYSLFSIVIVGEWAEITRPVFEQQPLLMVFFVAFVVFTTFGIMNVIIGVIVDHTMEAARDYEHHKNENNLQKQLLLARRIKKAVMELDRDNDGEISLQELEEGMESQELLELLMLAHLPKGCSAQELLVLVAHNWDTGSGVRCSEFMKGLYRLVDSNQFQHTCLMHMSLNSIRQMARETQREVQEQVKGSQALLLREIQELRKELTVAVASPAAAGSSRRPPAEVASSDRGCGAADAEVAQPEAASPRSIQQVPQVSPCSGKEHSRVTGVLAEKPAGARVEAGPSEGALSTPRGPRLQDPTGPPPLREEPRVAAAQVLWKTTAAAAPDIIVAPCCVTSGAPPPPASVGDNASTTESVLPNTGCGYVANSMVSPGGQPRGQRNDSGKAKELNPDNRQMILSRSRALMQSL